MTIQMRLYTEGKLIDSSNKEDDFDIEDDLDTEECWYNDYPDDGGEK